MKKKGFALSYTLFYVALAVCGGLRIWLKMGDIDLQTGFYTGQGNVVLVHNLLLVAVVVLLLLAYLLRQIDGDYPVLLESLAIPVLSICLGVAILLYTMEIIGVIPFDDRNMGVRLDRLPMLVCSTLGLLSAVGMIVSGGQGLGYRRMRGGALPLSAGIWMLVMLVCRFNAYTTLTTISDNLMAVLFMVFASVFFVGHARTLSGLARRDGRNYTIPAGLLTALFGLLLVVPNWIWVIVNRSWDIPALLLGAFESLFTVLLSVYALVFVRYTTNSIGSV